MSKNQKLICILIIIYLITLVTAIHYGTGYRSVYQDAYGEGQKDINEEIILNVEDAIMILEDVTTLWEGEDRWQ